MRERRDELLDLLEIFLVVQVNVLYFFFLDNVKESFLQLQEERSVVGVGCRSNSG